jgi:hypothetical protein
MSQLCELMRCLHFTMIPWQVGLQSSIRSVVLKQHQGWRRHSKHVQYTHRQLSIT